MPRRKVRSVVRWLAIAVATSSLAFGLLTFALTSWATITGIAAALLLAIAGVRLSGALSSTPEDEQIEYPYHVAQRGRRLALASLLAAGGSPASASPRRPSSSRWGRSW